MQRREGKAGRNENAVHFLHFGISASSVAAENKKVSHLNQVVLLFLLLLLLLQLAECWLSTALDTDKCFFFFFSFLRCSSIFSYLILVAFWQTKSGDIPFFSCFCWVFFISAARRLPQAGCVLPFPCLNLSPLLEWSGWTEGSPAVMQSGRPLNQISSSSSSFLELCCLVSSGSFQVWKVVVGCPKTPRLIALLMMSRYLVCFVGWFVCHHNFSCTHEVPRIGKLSAC